MRVLAAREGARAAELDGLVGGPGAELVRRSLAGLERSGHVVQDEAGGWRLTAAGRDLNGILSQRAPGPRRGPEPGG